MNFIFLTPDFPPYSPENKDVGGIGTWIYDFARGISLLGYSCTVLCHQNNLVEQNTFDSQQDFTIIRLKKLWWKNFKYPLVFFKLVTAVKRKEINVFIGCIASLACIIVFLARFFNLKTVTIAHGNDILRAKKDNRILKALKKLDVIVANSVYVKTIIEKQIGSKDNIITINPFFTPERFPEIEKTFINEVKTEYSLKGKRVLLSVGRLVERKNHTLVLNALPMILEDYPDIVYVIAGNGPYRAFLEKQVKMFGISGNVIFSGFVSQKKLRALYEIADIFIMPSIETEKEVEGFGIVFLEANYFNTPVIGARTGGIQDAIEEGINGFLVSPDNPEEISRILKNLFSDSKLYNTIQKKGKQRIMDSFILEKAVNNCLPKLIKYFLLF